MIDRAILDEKDANCARLADGGEKRGRRCLQGLDFGFKSGGHLKISSLVSVSELLGGEHTQAPGQGRPSSAVADAESTGPRAERATYRGIDHPRHPHRRSMLANRRPCRSRIVSAFPSRGT